MDTIAAVTSAVIASAKFGSVLSRIFFKSIVGIIYTGLDNIFLNNGIVLKSYKEAVFYEIFGFFLIYLYILFHSERITFQTESLEVHKIEIFNPG